LRLVREVAGEPILLAGEFDPLLSERRPGKGHGKYCGDKWSETHTSSSYSHVARPGGSCLVFPFSDELFPAPDRRPRVRELRSDALPGCSAVLHRVHTHGDRVAEFERRRAPAIARQCVRTSALHAPLGLLAIVVDDDLNPDVWIGPLHFLDRTVQL